jgi:predicted flap endonuclease-1-like 5' DNA nuclease
MDFFLGLVIGLLVGLLLNWVLSPLFDRSDKQYPKQATDLKETLTNIEQRLQSLEQALPGSVDKDSAQSAGRFTQVIVRRSDDLQRIKGIGPAFSHRLNEAGIHTFRELADSTPEHIKQIVDAQEWQEVDVETWIRMAHHLAEDGIDWVENER